MLNKKTDIVRNTLIALLAVSIAACSGGESDTISGESPVKAEPVKASSIKTGHTAGYNALRNPSISVECSIRKPISSEIL